MGGRARLAAWILVPRGPVRRLGMLMTSGSAAASAGLPAGTRRRNRFDWIPFAA
jgi:hypothetical protein